MSAAARPALRPIGDIVADLADGIEGLCAELLPGGRRERGEWVVDGADSPFGCSLGVHLRFPKRGVWKAWASGEAGDALDLVAFLKCGGDKKAAVKWAVEWLGGAPRVTPTPTLPHRGGGSDEGAAEIARRSARAKAIWLEAEPSLKGTPAERYLLGRSIDLGRPDGPLAGRQPRALRFHPRLYDDGIQGKYWPALVALVNAPAGWALHRIWLTQEGEKAPLFDARGQSQAKRSYGPKRGGLIPLWRGADGRALRDAAPGSAIWLSEGIEDGLALALLTQGQERIAAAIDLGNMALLELPAQIGTVVIAAQNDPWWAESQNRGHGAATGFAKAVAHFQRQGREVRIWRAPVGKDANDYLRHLERDRWPFVEHRTIGQAIADEHGGGEAA